MKASGTKSHGETPAAGIVERYFQNATATITAGLSDTLVTWAYIDPCNRPRSILLAWNDGSWDHRAYWGEDLIPGASRQFMGPIPATPGWVRLEVPATLVGLGGRTIRGMSFLTYDGRVWFDRTGVQRCTFPAPAQPSFGQADTVWLDDTLPSGAQPAGIVWSTAQHANGTKAIAADGSATPHDVWFTSASPMTLTASDALVAYVLIDPCAPPREIMLGWYDGTWDHRPYWGEDLFPIGTLRIRIGDVPAAGQWVRLEVAASSLNLAGRSVTGMGFYVNGGRAWFDRIGKAPASGSALGPLPSMTSASPSPASTTLQRHSLYTPELQLLARPS